MKSLILLTSALGLASSAAVRSEAQSAKVSYDGYKVVRLPVGTDASKVTEIVQKLGLSTWKGKPRAGAFSDIVVPPSQVDAFHSEIDGMDFVTMHEDLGASIAEESKFNTFAGTSGHAPVMRL